MFLCFALLLCFPIVGSLDAPEAWQMGFQDPATPVMQGIIDLHHDICFFMAGYPGFCVMDASTHPLSFQSKKESCSRENHSWNRHRNCLDCSTQA